jgi:D-beta-D-heptose 7-phosphate kinase/D-beta-D-heptose 1-phosphate adenosyltransferase
MNRILDRAGSVVWAAEQRHAGRRIVFSNGVFDILHAGHIRYLETARGFGDALIVAVNSDASVRGIKGPSRPINPEHERAEMLAALEFIDAVVVFDEATPAAIIEDIQPDVLVKGADWEAAAIVGREIVERHGGRVERVQMEEGQSTSGIIERVKNLPVR